MPPGSLEMSLRSSASSAAAEILVLAAICRSEIPRRSRAWRSFPPKSSINCAATLHEHPDSRKAGGARFLYGLEPGFVDSTNRDHGQPRLPAGRAQRVEAGNRMPVRLARRREHGAEHQVVAPALAARGL